MSSLTPETQESLNKYCANILKWNKVHNLLSSSQTESALWQRHIEDSTQLAPHFSDAAETVVDYGSGAGFPAIVLAVMFPQKEFVLFESAGKKATFLQDTSRLLGLKNVSVKNQRIEENTDVKADVITARAFAKVDEIFIMAQSFMKPQTKFVLLKGKNIDAETAVAKEQFSFDYQNIASKTGDGFIFIAENVKRT